MLALACATPAFAQPVSSAELVGGSVTLRRGGVDEPLALPCAPTAVLLRARLVVGCADGRVLVLDVRGTPRIISVAQLPQPVVDLAVGHRDLLVTVREPTTEPKDESARGEGPRTQDASPSPVVMRLAPPRLDNMLAVTISLLTPFEFGAGGAGALLSLSAEYHAPGPFAFRAVLAPLGGLVFFSPRQRSVGSYGGEFELQLDFRSFGLGAGAAFARGDDDAVFNFTQSLRIGAIDGLHFIGRTALRFDDQFPIARIEGALSIPLGQPSLVLHGAFFSADAALRGLGEIGLRLPIGTDRHVFLTPSIALVHAQGALLPTLGFTVETRR